MMKIVKFGLLAAVVALSATSCKKDAEDTFDVDQLVAVDQNQADGEAEDVGNLESQVMDQNNLSGRIAVDNESLNVPFDTIGCAKATLVRSGEGGTITIEFSDDNTGKGGCLCKDGRRRKGKIISTFDKPIRQEGAVVNTTFSGYGVTRRGSTEFLMIGDNSTKKTTTKKAPNPVVDGSVLEFDRDVNMNLLLPGGATFSHKGLKNMEVNVGQLGNRWDNIYITKAGSKQSGIDRKGREYNMEVNVDVVRKAECALAGIYKPVSGQITISHETKTKVVNFGNGICDNTVDITINGKKTKTRW